LNDYYNPKSNEAAAALHTTVGITNNRERPHQVLNYSLLGGDLLRAGRDYLRLLILISLGYNRHSLLFLALGVGAFGIGLRVEITALFALINCLLPRIIL
jgi:hypothetical protein